MPGVLVVGSYGQGNPGDEARLLALTRLLGPDSLIATTRTPAATGRAFGCRTVPSTARGVADALRHVDAVVVGGGTVLAPRRGADRFGKVAALSAIALAASARQVPLALIGAGAADLGRARDRRHARRVVSGADLLVLRDERSAAVLAATGAPTPFRVGADPAWTLVEGAPHKPPRSDAVAVALSPVAQPDLAPRLAAALRPIVASGRDLRLVPWESDPAGESERLAAAVAHRVGGATTRVVPPPSSFAAAVGELTGCRLVVGSRVNTLVAAAAAGSPFVALVDEPGATALARRLGQRSVPVHASAGVLSRTLALALEQPPATAAAVAAEVRRARETEQLLLMTLDRSPAERVGEMGTLALVSGAQP